MEQANVNINQVLKRGKMLIDYVKLNLLIYNVYRRGGNTRAMNYVWKTEDNLLESVLLLEMSESWGLNSGQQVWGGHSLYLLRNLTGTTDTCCSLLLQGM